MVIVRMPAWHSSGEFDLLAPFLQPPLIRADPLKSKTFFVTSKFLVLSSSQILAMLHLLLLGQIAIISPRYLRGIGANTLTTIRLNIDRFETCSKFFVEKIRTINKTSNFLDGAKRYFDSWKKSVKGLFLRILGRFVKFMVLLNNCSLKKFLWFQNYYNKVNVLKLFVFPTW